MEEVKVKIRHVILWEFKNRENAIKTAEKFVVFLTKVSLLTAKSEIGF